jgi:signal transduction histidine kinase
MILSIIVGTCYLTALGMFLVCARNAKSTVEYPGAAPYFIMQSSLFSFFTGAVVYRFITSSIEPLIVMNIVGVLLGIPYSVFAAEYTGRGPKLTRNRTAGIVFIGVLFIATYVARIYSSGFTRTISSIVSSVFVFSLPFIAIYGVLLLLRSGIQDDHTKKGFTGLLVLCGLLLSMIVLPLSFSQFDSDFFVIFALLLAAGFSVVQFRYGLFDTAPAMGYLGREYVFDEMTDPVAVVDQEQRIVDLSTAAEQTFEIQLAESVGKQVETVLNYTPHEDIQEPISIPTTGGIRSFSVTESPLHDREGNQVGHAYVFRDVTDEQTREQQLEVFNRVLRHNLRNDLDAIRGFAETLDEEDDDGPFDTATVAERIQSLSKDLSKTGETAKRAEQIRTKEQLGQEELSVDPFFDSLQSEIEERFPNCRLAVSTPPEPLQVHTDREVLETILLEVVENAIEHTEDPTPAVELRARPADGGVEFAVRDEGEGIPEHERDVLLDGEPTQLQHGAGIGLWLVSWGVTRLGGELALEDADTGGAVVRCSIPCQGSDPSSGPVTETTRAKDTRRPADGD